MVKIIRQGILPVKVEKKYTGVCLFCNAKIETDESDVIFEAERTPNGFRRQYCHCPTSGCDEKITMTVQTFIAGN